jgi:MoxR-like ATPase
MISSDLAAGDMAYGIISPLAKGKNRTIHRKVRQTYLKTWVFATSNGTRKLSERLLSRFKVMYLNKYNAI